MNLSNPERHRNKKKLSIVFGWHDHLTVQFISVRLPYNTKFSRHIFANFAIFQKSRNLSDAKNKCREHNVTRKLSDILHENQERIRLVSIKNSLQVQKKVNSEVNFEDVNVDLKLDNSF